MATNLIKHLPRSGLIRQNNLGFKLQCRNSSSGGGQQPSPPHGTQTTQAPAIALRGSSEPGNSNLALGVGLALGVSVCMLVQDKIVKNIFPSPEPPAPEKPAPTIDPMLVEQLISHDRKVNQLESQLRQLREDLRERSQQEARANVTQAENLSRGSGNVFELSEVIQANNLANDAKYARQLEEQRKALIREHLLKVEGEILKVENKYRPIINKIRELEAHLESQRQIQQREGPARVLWLSCQSLLDKLRTSSQEPLEKDPSYEILKQFAAENNPLAISILDSIPPKALKEGVQSQETLRERFDRIEKVCKRVALVDAHGAGLGKYLLSYMQSLFIIERSEVPEDEILGRLPVDPTRWTTFDILARVRCCLKSNNLEQAVRYANQLKGQARVVARDWIRDARVHLTARQAFVTLTTHAEAIAADSMYSSFKAGSNKIN